MQKTRRAATAVVSRLAGKGTRIVLALFFVFVASFATAVSIYIYAGTRVAHAATSSTLNFQARLLQANGAVVADGSYSVQFKLYDASSGGTNEWTETQNLPAKNGYITASLGSVTPFGATIDWSQEHWLTMNVNGDGEMGPTRMKMTAVPYSFRSGQADLLTNGSGTIGASGLVQLGQAATQNVNTSTTAVVINQQGSGGLLLLQSGGIDRLSVTNGGDLTVAGGVILGNNSGTTAGTLRWSGSDFEGYTGSGWVSLTAGGGASGSIGGNTLSLTSSVANMAATATTNAGLLAFTSATGVSSTIGTTTGFVAPSDGSFRSCVVNNNAAITGGSVSVRWRVNGVSVGAAACTMNTSNPRFGATSIDAGVVTFSAGDTINIAFESAALAPAGSAEFTAYWAVEFGTNNLASTAFVQGGNSFGSAAILGTADNQGLNLITNGNTRIGITNAGLVSIVGALDVGGGLDLNGTGITDTGIIAGVTDVVSAGGLELISGAGQDITLTPASGQLIVAGSIAATAFIGDGSAVTGLDAANIASGTLLDARLSANVGLTNLAQTYSARPTFSAGIILGNTATTAAGTLRWTGADFEGYDGSGWVSLTGGSASPLGVQLIQAYDNSGGTDLNTATPTAVPWSAETKKDTGFTHNNVTDNTRVYLDEPGWYRIGYQISGENQSTNRNNVFCQIRLSGTTYNTPSGSYSYARDTTNAYSTNTSSIYIETTAANEYVEVLCSQAGSAGAQLALAGQSWIVVERTEPVGGSGSNAFVQGGNAFGVAALIGTTDAQELRLITNGTRALTIDSGGDANFSYNVGFNATSPDNLISVNTPSTADATAQVLVSTGGTANKGLVLQAVGGQAANLFEAQNSTGGVLTQIDKDGRIVLGNDDATPQAGTLLFHDGTAANGFTAVLGVNTLTGNRVLNLPDVDGTLCVAGSLACGFVAVGPTSAQTDTTTNSSIFINKTGASGDILTLQKNGSTVASISNAGALTLQVSDASALRVANTGGTQFFNVDTNAGLVQIGGATADANATLLVLDTKNTAGDPSGANGASYYNSADNKARCYEDGYWTDCITSGLLGETTLGSANATISVSLAKQYESLECRVEIKGKSASGIVYLRFNNDATAGTYSWNTYYITGTAVADAQSASDTEIQLSSTVGSNLPFSGTLKITNFSDTRKSVDWTGVSATTIGTNPQRYSGVGVMNLTSGSISSVQFVSSTGTFAAGSHAWCQGRNVR